MGSLELSFQEYHLFERCLQGDKEAIIEFAKEAIAQDRKDERERWALKCDDVRFSECDDSYDMGYNHGCEKCAKTIREG